MTPQEIEMATDEELLAKMVSITTDEHIKQAIEFWIQAKISKDLSGIRAELARR